jgi:hypothetical protein
VANIQSNPWSFTSADPAIAAITSATLNADSTVTIVSAALTFNTTVEPALGFTVIGVTNPLYNGFYKLIIGVSGATTFVLAPQFSIPAGTAASTGGTLIQCLYRSQVRIEDMSWQGLAGAAVGTQLDLRDRSGNILWQSQIYSITAGTGYQNRGKLFWVNGFSPNVIPTNTILIVTVD